jgi:hypothetical protein
VAERRYESCAVEIIRHRRLLPALESLSIASADEVDGDLLAARLRDEAVATRATVAWQHLVGVVAHKSAQQ